MKFSAIKIILSILLFLCLLDMSYSYYQFVRFASCIAFSYFAYKANEKEEKSLAIIYIILAILFQPFLKISLGRELWNIVDVIIGIGLLISLFKKKKSIKTHDTSIKVSKVIVYLFCGVLILLLLIIILLLIRSRK